MIILTIRTDNPEAEIGLFDGDDRLAYLKWQAHRQLAETIHEKINVALQSGNCQMKDVQGLICFQGPGSFTGLRIGLTVANTLAYGLDIPIVATAGNDWQAEGIKKLLNGEDDGVALPEYGAEVHITQPKK